MDNKYNILINESQVCEILNRYSSISIPINNIIHYQKAFVHESYFQSIKNILNDKKIEQCFLDFIPNESNERLEYLGDHILKSIIGRYLFERYPNEREGFLTRLKIKIEKCSMLHKIAVELGFKKFLLLSVQVENQTILGFDKGRNTPSYFEDAFEAFIGAIIQDHSEQGYIYADHFVRGVIENIVDFAELNNNNDNFKDSLQRFFQYMKWPNPVYHYININDDSPMNRRVFIKMIVIRHGLMDNQKIKSYTKQVLLKYKDIPPIYDKINILLDNNYILGVGTGRKNIQAEQDCSKQALLNLGLSLNY